MKKLRLSTALLLSGLFAAAEGGVKSELLPPGGNFNSRFLVVVDRQTYQLAQEEITAYKIVLEEEGLGTEILIGNWNDPDVLKEEIRTVYQSGPVLEGAVFMGNIPVVRVQNFQHATTAFKMNEDKFPVTDASVTTDRFYDDLDLQFERTGIDDKNSLIFFYRLKESSPQKVQSEFYSARMLPPSDMGTDPGELLKRYLKKVVEAHRENNPLDRFVIFNGHGYNSDCLTAWQNEQFAIREQIPAAFKSSKGNGFYNFRQDPFMKFRLFDKLQQRGTDLFVFHEHGDYDTQYINGDYPAMNMLEYPGGKVTGPLTAMGVLLRNTFRKYSGERAEKFKQNMMSEYGLTDEFFSSQRLDSLKVSDSLFAANVNIVLQDLPQVKMQPRMTIFDACYNGSFHQPGYVAGYHVFGHGNTIVAQGNTVNVLQDKWALELLGMLAEGARAGFWQKDIQYLESHLIGDPTFRFYAQGQECLNRDLASGSHKTKVWKKYLRSSNPNFQAIAIRQLSKNPPAGFSELLLKIFKESKWYSVRMEALKRLLERDGENTVEAIRLGLDDPYEYIRRVAARYAGYSGDPRLISPLVHTVIFSNESQRVQYAAQGSLEMFDLDEVIREINRQMPEADDVSDYYRSRQTSQVKSLQTIRDKTANPEERISAIRSLRNYNNHKQVDMLLPVLIVPDEDLNVRINLAEALGWFNLSIRKFEIVEALEGVRENPSSPRELKDEICQSLLRLNE